MPSAPAPRPQRASKRLQAPSSLVKAPYGRSTGWERRLRARAAAAGGLGGSRPRAPAIGGDLRRLSARARCAICARAAPPARLEANAPPRRCSSKPHGIGPWCIRAREGAGNDGRGTRNQDHPGREICDAATGVQNNEDGDAARETTGDDQSKARPHHSY